MTQSPSAQQRYETISINYSANSVVSSPGTTVHYNFMTTGVPGSTSELDRVLKH